MKFADTPSRSAGLIISVFGVASSPMVPSRTAHGARAWKRGESVRGSAGSVKDRAGLGAPETSTKTAGHAAHAPPDGRAGRFTCRAGAYAAVSPRPSPAEIGRANIRLPSRLHLGCRLLIV